MSIFFLIPLSGIIINVFFIGYTVAIEDNNKVGRAFIHFCILNILYLFADLLTSFNFPITMIEIIVKLRSFGYLWPGWLFLRLIYSMINKKRDLFIIFTFLFSTFSILLVFFTDLIIKSVSKNSLTFTGNPGVLYLPIILISTVIPGIYAIHLLAIRAYRKKEKYKKFIPLVLETVLVISFATTLAVIIPTFTKTEVFPLTSIQITLINIIFFLGIVKQGFMDIGINSVAKNIFNSIPIGILLVGEKGKIFRYNNASVKILGKAVETTKRADQILSNYDYNLYYNEFETVAKSSIQRVSITQIDATYNGGVIGKILFIHDLTKQQQLRNEIIKRQKLESISILAGGLAHDFNNYLTIILSNLSIIKSEIPKDTAIFRGICDAQESAQSAKSITLQLMSFAKDRQLTLESLDISNLIETTATISLSGSRCTFSINAPKKDIYILGDRGRLTQVFSNIIINAKQAMPHGGNIEISIEILKVEKENSGVLESGNYIKIAIKDRGVGIAYENIEKVFDPYFTTKENGNGLGLPSCLAIINEHGGKIDVESLLNKYTIFTIFLPTSSKTKDSKKDSRIKIPLNLTKILLMDDNKSILRSVRWILKKNGYNPVLVTNGEEAIKVYQEAIANHIPFDAVILDLNIPGKMGADKTIEKLLEIDQDLVAIVTSGSNESPVITNFQDYGFSASLMKPFDDKMILKTLQKVLNEKTTFKTKY